MTAITYLPPITTEVGSKIYEYITQEFFGNPADYTTCSMIKFRLEQLVPGSNWDVKINNWGNGVVLDVRFVDKKSAVLYTLKWL